LDERLVKTHCALLLGLLIGACEAPVPAAVAAAATPAPQAQDPAGAQRDAQSADAIKAAIAKRIGARVEDFHPGPVPGFYEIIHDHDILYATTDGKFLFQGDITSLDSGEHITETRRRADRLAALADLGDDNMIEFDPAPPIARKYLVTVFTDVDCPYCRLLHSQMAQYNARGIAIRYAFFPRSGLNTPSYYKAVSVWCSADRRAALTHAKNGENVQRLNCDNPVGREYLLGEELGLQGTPMMIMPNGQVSDGYMPPDELAKTLEKMDQEAQKKDVPLSSKS
jgi:thiol:disulfide interchange protein DsbC